MAKPLMRKQLVPNSTLVEVVGTRCTHNYMVKALVFQGYEVKRIYLDRRIQKWVVTLDKPRGMEGGHSQ